MQPRLFLSQETSKGTPPETIDRISPIISIDDYSAAGFVYETPNEFDAGLRYGRLGSKQAKTAPTEWLAQRIHRATAFASSEIKSHTQLQIQAPGLALGQQEHLEERLKTNPRTDGVERPVTLIFEDTAITSAPREALQAIEAFRSIGLYIGIDARRCWRSLKSHELLSMTQAVWVNASQIEGELDLRQWLQAASSIGKLCICHGGYWADATLYSEAGVTHMLRGRADA